MLTVVLALLVLLLAGCSEMLGQLVVLVVNRVPPRRFLLCLLANSCFLMLETVAMTLSIWVFTFIFGSHLGLLATFLVVSFGHFPMVASFLAVIPHFGIWLERFLKISVFMLIVSGVGAQTGLAFWKTLLCCGYGGLVLVAPGYLGALRLDRFQDALWNWASGRQGAWPR